MAGEEDTTTQPPRQTAADPTDFVTAVPSDRSYMQRTAKGIRPKEAWATQIQKDITNRTIKILGYGTSGGVSFNGPALMDEEGYISRPEYELSTTSVETELMNLSAEDRLVFAQQLKRVGYYGGAEISESIKRKSGFNETDMSAMLKFMRDSNLSNKTIRAMLPELMRWDSASMGGSTIKVTPKEDIAYYMKQASLTNLGRMPTKAEIDQAVKYIQNVERAASGQGTTAPSTSVLAQAQAQQAAPGERAAYSVGQAISLAFRALAS